MSPVYSRYACIVSLTVDVTRTAHLVSTIRATFMSQTIQIINEYSSELKSGSGGWEQLAQHVVSCARPNPREGSGKMHMSMAECRFNTNLCHVVDRNQSCLHL